MGFWAVNLDNVRLKWDDEKHVGGVEREGNTTA